MTTVGQDGATVARPSRTLTLGRALQAPTMMADGLAVGVLVIVCIVALTTFRAYGLGWDDYTHSQMGELLLRLYGSGFKDQRALSFVNLYMYGGGFDMLAALVAKVLPFDLFETRRLVGAAVGVVGLIAAWRTARRLGGPRAGFLAIVLLAACPLYFGHMFMNAKDAPFATAMAILAYGFVRLMQEYPTPQPSSIAWFGLGLGLSVGSRVLGDLSAISGAGALALTFGAEWRSLGLSTAARRIGRFILVLLPGLVLAYLIMGLIWPWSIVSFDNPLRALEYFSRFFEKPWRELFDGVRIPTIDMPRSYVPTLLALTLPEIFLLLSLGGVVATLAACFRRTITISTRASYVYLLLAALAPLERVLRGRQADLRAPCFGVERRAIELHERRAGVHVLADRGKDLCDARWCWG